MRKRLTAVVEVDPARLVEHEVLHGQVGEHRAEDGDEQVRLEGDPEFWRRLGGTMLCFLNIFAEKFGEKSGVF
jgi:hypothetical protein